MQHVHLALKLVSVLFAALGLVFPTFNLGFYVYVSVYAPLFAADIL